MRNDIKKIFEDYGLQIILEELIKWVDSEDFIDERYFLKKALDKYMKRYRKDNKC